MARNAPQPKPSLATATSSPPASELPGAVDLDSVRAQREAKKLADWVNNNFSQAKSARTNKQTQWYENLSFIFGRHWINVMPGNPQTAGLPFFQQQRSPYYRKQRTINRLRSIQRTEHSKFLQSIPNINVVPSTSEDNDLRAALAGEQVWQSVSLAQNLRSEFSNAAWWMTTTGTGIIKTQWNSYKKDEVSGQQGCIEFGAITPFHLFVPDLRERKIEDQPWVTQAMVKPLSWAKQHYGDKVKGIEATSTSANSILDETYLDLTRSNENSPDSVVVKETWIKPGVHEMLPDGGVVIMVEDVIVAMYESFPYTHGQYPFTVFSHIDTSTFYADATLRDLIPLQKEYNESRTDISESARRSGRPQLLAPKGSIVPSKITNEPGLVIEYLPGGPPPQWAPPPPLPEYVVSIPDRVLADMEDLSGQHEVTQGQAPAGVTAGTAISYLGERDSAYLTAQYMNIEDGYARIAKQTLQLFVQYVDVPRSIKTIGPDQTYDMFMLKGADIKHGTDVRVERGSAVGESKAAQDARLMDMWSLGIITDPNQMLSLLEIGGSQRILDLLDVARKKAARENSKMKALKPEAIMQADQQFQMMQQAMAAMAPMGELGAPAPVGTPFGAPPEELAPEPAPSESAVMQTQPMGPPTRPPLVAVDDFDLHDVHIEEHNKYRMGQEYEMLPDEIKAEFEAHVKAHEEMMVRLQMNSFMDMYPGSADPAAEGAPGAPEQGGAEMADNGQVPGPPAPEGGE